MSCPLLIGIVHHVSGAPAHPHRTLAIQTEEQVGQEVLGTNSID